MGSEMCIRDSIGTTDTEADPAETPYLQLDEADYLLEHVNQYLAKPLTLDQVTGGFAGLRPLLQADPDASSKSLVRDHEVEVDEKTGLVSIMGGKWTTYRLMAQDTIDVCSQRLGVHQPSKTDKLLLLGAEGYSPAFINSLTTQYPTVNPQLIKHLSETYGTQATALLTLMEQDSTLAEPLVNRHPFVKAEVIYAARAEMALTLEDLLLRRIRLGLVDWKAALSATPTAATLLGTELGWSPEYQQGQQDAFTGSIQQHIDWAGLSATRPELVAGV